MFDCRVIKDKDRLICQECQNHIYFCYACNSEFNEGQEIFCMNCDNIHFCNRCRTNAEMGLPLVAELKRMYGNSV